MSTNIMKCLLTYVCVVAFPAAGQEGRWGAPEEPTVMELVSVARMWGETNCGPQSGLDEYFAQEFQGTGTGGRRYDRADALSPGDDRDCSLGEVKIQFFGDVVAIAYGSESLIRTNEDGTESQRCLVWTDTWLKRGGSWQIIAAQDNVIECR